jgi:Ribbon-helix-helix protein, copG family
MKTTLLLDDALVMRLKNESARQGRSMSALMEEALHLLFREARAPRPAMPPLPVFDGGGPLIDVASDDALRRAMEGT